MSTSPMMSVAAAAESVPPPPPVEHMPHPHKPGDPPPELSAKHPHVVNYAISAGGVVLGVALITTFALICRWRKRRRQRALDDEIDERIREKTLSRLEANRTDSLSKLPAAALASQQSVLRPLPLLLPYRGAHSANSSAETLPRPRQTCVRTSDQRLSCGCSNCVVFAHSSTLAPSASGSALATLASFNKGTVRRSPRQPRSVSSYARGRQYPHHSGLRAFSLGSAAPRTQRHTDENIHRAASTRTPSPRVAPLYDYTPALEQSANGTHTRGIGIGIMTATNTAGSLGCPSPALTTPSLGFSTPRTGSSAAGSPALSLSNDAGATTLNPIVIVEDEHERLPSAGNSPAADRSLSSVDVCASRGHLGPSLAHMHVSPLVQDGAGSPAASVYASPRSSSSGASSPQALSIQHCNKPRISDVLPDTIKTGEMPFSPRAEGERQQQGWFTEVDWFGADGPLACYESRS